MNKVIDYQLTDVGYSEPVSLQEAKDYGRLSTGSAEDDLIEQLITASRQAIEAYTGLSLIPKSCEAVLSVDQRLYELPYGPVTGTPVFKDEDGNTLSSVVLVGFQFPKMKEPYTNGYLTAQYDCGYAECPADLKTAILDQFVFNYQNRGDNQDNSTVCLKAQKSCDKYSRQPFFL
jgi:hypothetical protein